MPANAEQINQGSPVPISAQAEQIAQLERILDRVPSDNLRHVDAKRIMRKYNLRMLLFNLPSAAVAAALLIIVLLFRPQDDVPEVMYKAIIYGLYYCAAYSFIVCLTGSVAADILIKAHSRHTYIEIVGSQMVVSQHSQTVFFEGRFVHYKKLWVIELRDVESVACDKNHILINGKARLFNERADWLGYEVTDDGIDFDNWWYNSNGGEIVSNVEITDFYSSGEEIAELICDCAEKICRRDERFRKFREEMLRIASSSKHKSRKK